MAKQPASRTKLKDEKPVDEAQDPRMGQPTVKADDPDAEIVRNEDGSPVQGVSQLRKKLEKDAEKEAAAERDEREAGIQAQERFEALRQQLRNAETKLHPSMAVSTDLERLEFVVECVESIVRGDEKLPPKPNRPPVAVPGRGRGFAGLSEEERAKLKAEREAEEAGADGDE
jgi:hypothetical protein